MELIPTNFISRTSNQKMNILLDVLQILAAKRSNISIKSSKKTLSNGINDILLKFIGTGPTLEKCKKYAEHHNLNCEFIEGVKT